MYTRAERIGQAVVVLGALIFALAVGSFVLRGGAPEDRTALNPGATATQATRKPDVKFDHQTCCAQTARFLRVPWESSLPVVRAAAQLVPDPGFPCEASVEAGGGKGVMSCQGLLRGGTDYIATLSVTTTFGTFPIEHRFKTMGDRLVDVRWFTEFEDPKGDPLSCAAASVRIVQNFTAGADPMTAEQILQTGRAYNRSRDPGLDPAAIAAVQKRLEPRNNYHYYRLPTREEATKSAVYWLVRSGKPVHVISLAGQHDPVLIGFVGTFGTYYDDPANQVAQVVVQDPQRGDMRPETANRRPDKYRTPGFQSGQPLGLDEWYRDEWWLGFVYQAVIRMPDGSNVNIERSDGAYPTPHWGGQFVILVDDGDAEWPSDREGRVKWH
jgi:hypothetical protein